MPQQFYSGNVGGNWGPPPGYMQAAMEPSRIMSASFANMGKSIGDGIQQYMKNKDERAELIGTVEALGGALGGKMETAGALSESDAKMLKDISNAHNLGTPQLKGLIAGMAHKDRMLSEDRTLAFQQAQIMQGQQQINDARNAATQTSRDRRLALGVDVGAKALGVLGEGVKWWMNRGDTAMKAKLNAAQLALAEGNVAAQKSKADQGAAMGAAMAAGNNAVTLQAQDASRPLSPEEAGELIRRVDASNVAYRPDLGDPTMGYSLFPRPDAMLAPESQSSIRDYLLKRDAGNELQLDSGKMNDLMAQQGAAKIDSASLRKEEQNSNRQAAELEKWIKARAPAADLNLSPYPSSIGLPRTTWSQLDAKAAEAVALRKDAAAFSKKAAEKEALVAKKFTREDFLSRAAEVNPEMVPPVPELKTESAVRIVQIAPTNYGRRMAATQSYLRAVPDGGGMDEFLKTIDNQWPLVEQLEGGSFARVGGQVVKIDQGKNAPPLPPAMLDDVSRMVSASKEIDSLLQSYEAYVKKGGTTGVVLGKLSVGNPFYTDAQILDARFKSMEGMIGADYLKLVGALSEQERKMVQIISPGIGSDPRQARDFLRNFQKRVRNNMAGTLDVYQGGNYDVSGLRNLLPKDADAEGKTAPGTGVKTFILGADGKVTPKN